MQSAFYVRYSLQAEQPYYLQYDNSSWFMVILQYSIGYSYYDQ